MSHGQDKDWDNVVDLFKCIFHTLLDCWHETTTHKKLLRLHTMEEIESVPRKKSEENELAFQNETGGTELQDEKDTEEIEMDKELQKLEEELRASGKKPFLAARIIPKPKVFIWFLASFASIGGLLFGLDQSLISGAELYIPSDLHIDSSRMSMITGFMALGAIFGALW